MPRVTLTAEFIDWPAAKTEEIVACSILEGQPLSLSVEPNGSFTATLSTENTVEVFATQVVEVLNKNYIKFNIDIVYEKL